MKSNLCKKAAVIKRFLRGAFRFPHYYEDLHRLAQHAHTHASASHYCHCHCHWKLKYMRLLRDTLSDTQSACLVWIYLLHSSIIARAFSKYDSSTQGLQHGGAVAVAESTCLWNRTKTKKLARGCCTSSFCAQPARRWCRAGGLHRWYQGLYALI